MKMLVMLMKSSTFYLVLAERSTPLIKIPSLWIVLFPDDEFKPPTSLLL